MSKIFYRLTKYICVVAYPLHCIIILPVIIIIIKYLVSFRSEHSTHIVAPITTQSVTLSALSDFTVMVIDYQIPPSVFTCLCQLCLPIELMILVQFEGSSCLLSLNHSYFLYHRHLLLLHFLCIYRS